VIEDWSFPLHSSAASLTSQVDIEN